jgi:hypothetical protein
MAKREKILIILMIVAVGYGAVKLFSGFLFKEPALETPVHQTEDIVQFSTITTRAIDSAGLEPAEAYILELAPRDRTRDFFYKWPPDTERTEPVPEMDQDMGVMVYNGFIEMGQRRLAVINGIEYQEGDNLALAGYRVVSISPVEVIIESIHNKTKTTIPYVEELTPY